jgi:Rnl2 family RNA ligase
MFKKYPSLTNHYNKKDVEYYIRLFGDDINKTLWCVTEKIHGANFSFLVSPNSNVEYFSRNQKITGTDFYGASETINYVISRFDTVQKLSNKYGYSVRFFGELYGSGIQKGVKYPSGRHYKIFNVMINDRMLSEMMMRTFMDRIGLTDLLVPILDLVPFDDALNYRTNFNSTFNNIDHNICEGIVIKPYKKVFVDGNGSMFYIKKKNEQFKEKQRVKKVRTETQYTEEVNKWHETFLSYIHEERIESVFSKEGRISSFKDIGKYIPLVHIDALDTFNKEEDEWDADKFTKNERKYIFNSSKHIVELLKKELMS